MSGSAAHVHVSDEQFATGQHGVELCYQTFGDSSADPLLLVMGLGGPMTWWDPALCTALAERGFFVIRYDNRDTGRSTKVGGRVPRAALLRAFAGRGGPPPYTLSDLADDAVALLDHLGVSAAHVVGVSMGGMIAQTLAVEHRDRLRSLTSIMSTTGKRSVGWQHPKLLPMLIAPRGPGRAAYKTSARLWQLIGSPAYPAPHAEVLAQAEETWDRGFSASGVMRQMLAILAQPNRSSGLRRLDLPALVIHGTEDQMVHVSGGRATAAPSGRRAAPRRRHGPRPAPRGSTFADAIRRIASG
ncbi:MAG: alpha/beta hydrolase [Nocardioides sp.]